MSQNSLKKIFIAQLQQGQQVSDIFLLSRKTLAETKAGKPYLALALMDKTGEIEARLWDDAVRYDAEADVGDFVLVNATAKSYRDQLQLGVSSLQHVDDAQVQLEQFMPTSKRPLAEMEAELQAVIGSVQDAPLQQLLQAIFQGETLERFVRAPAAKKMHHAYIGGLLEHTLSIIGMAVKTAEHYPMIDGDMLVAGALLHDIAKISEFDFGSVPFDYTDQGRLVGHLVLGAEMVRRAAENIQGLDRDKVDRVTHLILSHHGQLEFGSPVLPMTPEAMLLHHLDDMDAKMNYMEQLCDKMEEPGWQWTAYQRPLERFLYLQGRGEEQNVPMAPQSGQSKQGAPRKYTRLSNGQAKQKQQSLF
ncbi:3'-5' exoribonuclease YhaM family protein [Desulfogranum marinum]|uniref:3'-5' exoribonuclease YhaM family protein n=1 Tax=Desulfogranum marinum TaxID=453220 RepID=UPI0029C6401C|nr:3'-5' exoribonuclease YhaM family protein [Desulfogranum marinum]